MNWNDEVLAEAITEMRARRGDTTSIEVKRATGGVPVMPETLAAFANMPNGGTVILGIDEAGGRFDVVGVHDIAALEAGLVSIARQTVQPAPHLDFQTFHVDGRPVLVAHVAPLRIADKPATVGGRSYLRQADGDYEMHPHELRMLEVAKLHSDEQVNYDLARAIGRGRADLDADLVADYLDSVRRHDRRLRDLTDDQILQMTSVLNASGEPTVAGLYSLGTYPQGQYPALTVTAAVQLAGGEGQARNRNLQDFTGPIPVLLEDVLAWVENNLDTVHRYRSDGHMEEISELPLNAVRELVANALVHRDLGPSTLGTGKQIQIRLTAKSFFIQSPGGLRGVSLAQLVSVEHAQAAVNQRLYQIAKRLTTSDGASVIEGEGGGIREVFRSVQDRGLPRPQLFDTGVQFKALLWRPRSDVETAPRPVVEAPADRLPVESASLQSTAPTRNEPLVLRMLRTSPNPLTIHELVDGTGLTIGQVRYALSQPLRDGLVVMDGQQGSRSTRYRLPPRD
ncbi:ATP-binding protein [Luteococcus sp. OSA5]|uniref:ATP-binding protein n=1 Tax=Luteococcus sp. OSA5 TaxID=3401630 RepID=UPI003B42F7FA